MKRFSLFIGLAACGVGAGCAATYVAPAAQSQHGTSRFSAAAAEVFRAAQRTLIAEGFQILNANADAGTISTATRDLRVTPDTADCGTTMGLDYLKDNRTATQVAYGIIVHADELSVRANIQGSYRIGRFDQDITLTCVSKGVMEDALLAKILSEVAHQR